MVLLIRIIIIIILHTGGGRSVGFTYRSAAIIIIIPLAIQHRQRRQTLPVCVCTAGACLFQQRSECTLPVSYVGARTTMIIITEDAPRERVATILWFVIPTAIMEVEILGLCKSHRWYKLHRSQPNTFRVQRLKHRFIDTSYYNWRTDERSLNSLAYRSSVDFTTSALNGVVSERSTISLWKIYFKFWKQTSDFKVSRRKGVARK